jgi:ABC-type Mn2+/Zn2+ transport system permease subunit
MRGIINVVFGIIFIVGGLAGKLTLRIPHGSLVVVAVGALFLLAGLARLGRNN